MLASDNANPRIGSLKGMGRTILDDDALEIRDPLVEDRVDGFPKESGTAPSGHDDAEQRAPLDAAGGYDRWTHGIRHDESQPSSRDR
jgi:hypothetical protein